MLNCYMGYDSNVGSKEVAVLVFAKDSKEARKIGWEALKALHPTAWMDTATRRLRKNLEYLYREADQEKLAAGIPHATDSMRVCPTCELWGEDGGEPDENGRCGYCR